MYYIHLYIHMHRHIHIYIYIHVYSYIHFLIYAVLKYQPSINMVPEHGEEREFRSQKEFNPYATYEGKFLHLAPPPKANLEQAREPYKVEHLEQAICDHVVQRTGRGT